jgi:hypothetical protein
MVSHLLLFNFLSATAACGVGLYSYWVGKISIRWIHHFFYFLFFSGILLSCFLGFLEGHSFYLLYPVALGMGVLPFLPKGSFYHRWLGIFSFFLTGIQFLLFK